MTGINLNKDEVYKKILGIEQPRTMYWYLHEGLVERKQNLSSYNKIVFPIVEKGYKELFVGTNYGKYVELDRIQKEIDEICMIERIEKEIATDHHQGVCESSSPTSSNTMDTIDLCTVRDSVSIDLVQKLEAALPQKEQHSTTVSNTMTVVDIEQEQHRLRLHNSARAHAGLEPVVNLPTSIKRSSSSVPGRIHTVDSASASGLNTITTIKNSAAQQTPKKRTRRTPDFSPPQGVWRRDVGRVHQPTINDIYLNSNVLLNNMQRTIFFSIVTNLKNNNVHANHLATETATNWNLQHYNSIPVNHVGLGGKMRTAHAKQLLLESYNHLKLNQVQQHYTQRKVQNIPTKEDIKSLSFRDGNAILKSHRIGQQKNKQGMVDKLTKLYYPQDYL